VMAADRNVTLWNGNALLGQESGTKILAWPRRKALVGAVGRGAIGDVRIGEWLYNFIGDHIDFTSAVAVANDMRDRLQSELSGEDIESLIIMFLAFGNRDGHTVPECWHITNVHGVSSAGYDPPTDTFAASERIQFHLPTVAPGHLREMLRTLANQHAPFWFHQGMDLAVFNTLSEGIKVSFRALHAANKLSPPQTLQDWERHAKMWVLMYGSYFEAFSSPNERYVGGGADVLSIPWP
jgi:hypothetical protein